MSTLADNEVKQWSVGTEIGLIVKENGTAVNLAAATAKSIVFLKPSKKVVVKPATFKTDGTDGHIVYVTEAAFLDEVGGWYYEADVTIGAWTGQSSREFLNVSAAIPVPSV